MDKATVSDNIKSIRLKLGLTMIQMAESLGMTRQSYAKLERGNVNYFSPHIEEIARMGNVSTEELVLGYEPNPEPARELGEARELFQRQKQNLVNRYEDTIMQMRKEIDYLKLLCDSQKQTVDSLIQSNELLRKQILALQAGRGESAEEAQKPSRGRSVRKS